MRGIRSLWGRLTRTPQRRDTAAALLFLVLGLVLLTAEIRLGIAPALPEQPLRLSASAQLALSVLTLLIAVAGTRFRSTRPALTLPLVLIAFALDLGAGSGGSLAILLVVTDGCYAVARYGSAALARTQLGIVTLGTAALAVLRILLGASVAETLLVTLLLAAIFLLPIWWGTSLRLERDRTDLERELGRQRLVLLSSQQREDTRAALAADRAATGAELHDLVANQLASIALRAEAAELGQGAGRPVSEADLGAIAAASRSALRHLHELIDLLREEPNAVGAERSADGLPGVLAHARALGSPVRWQGGDGEADGFAAALAQLPTEMRRDTLRILAEALANAARHGAAAEEGAGGVALRWAAGERTLTAINAVPEGRSDALAASSEGIGQRTMAERAARIWARIVSGPQPAPQSAGASSTWMVALTLPERGPR